MHQPSEKLNSFLRMAIVAGVTSAVQMHIQRGDTLNALDVNGNGPLHLAALKGHADIIWLLLEAGADQTIVDSNGKTPIEVARGHGFEECVQAFDRHIKDLSSGNTRLYAFEFEDDGDSGSSIEGWEAEADQIAPAGDENLIRLAAAVNSEISAHRVINTDTNWDELDLYLPESINIRSEDFDWLSRLKLLFGIAIKEGSVPSQLVNKICEDEYGIVDERLFENISRVLYDLAAQLDERIGCGISDWHHETSSADELVDEAVSRVEDLSTNTTDPLKHYIKDMRSRLLLDGEQEVILGKEIEISTNDAMEILSRWPEALRLIVEQCAPIKAELDAEHDEDDGDEEFEGLDEVLDVIEQPAKIRKLLLSVGLSRGELLKLSMTLSDDQSDLANAFKASLSSGEKARNTMITSNLRLVLSIARQYAWSSLPFEELIQVGNIGLMKAVDKWDWKRGFKLSTYATWWIKQSISKEIADSESLIRVPVHLQEKLRKAKREVLKGEKLIAPSIFADEIAKRMGGAPERVNRLLAIQEGPVSFDDEDFDQNSSQSYMEIAGDMDPASLYEKTDTRNAIVKILERLKERDRNIVAMRFGVNSDEPSTLEECGQAFGLTRERVRQVEAKAFKTLSAPVNKAVLAEIYYT